jgi:4-diphosphocytidyl-2-C-methyl-D-erythritol kinase
MGGGLGGGSSDAATTLVALNALWKTGLSVGELANLGLKLGADVPVFVRGHAAWGEGVGDRLEPVELPEPWYLVVIPPVQVSTAEIFSAPELTRDANPLKIRNFLRGQGENVCEPVVRRRYPEVSEALDWLSGHAPARMSGTGACIFAALTIRSKRKTYWRRFPPA